MEPNKAAGTADLWYVDNYILLKDYYDRTISRIAARCVRKGNIAIEDYPFFGYILDVLEEISETGEYIPVCRTQNRRRAERAEKNAD